MRDSPIDITMKLYKFSDINISDPFFNTLKVDYPEFSEWFSKKSKSGAQAYIKKNTSGLLEAFLYLKKETEEVTDVNPPMPAANRLKVGTLKIEAHNTRLGEGFIKKIMQSATYIKAEEIYVTVFPKHEPLIKLLKRYGFVEYGTKGKEDNPELVFVKDMKNLSGDVLLDYPFVHINGKRKFVLAINPEFHTPLFPDSILNTELRNKDYLVRDVAHTNSIHKIYLSYMTGLDQLQRGDILLIYRTKDKGSANYSSVITSICVVEEVKTTNNFVSIDEYLKYTNSYSIFQDATLRALYSKPNLVVIKMTYNVAFNRRVIRKELLEKVGLNKDIYWGFFQITDEQFNKIIELGNIDESIIVN